MIAPFRWAYDPQSMKTRCSRSSFRRRDHRIGERLPAAVAVRTAPESTHGQDRVHRQHALNDPPLEASRRRDGPPRVIVNLPEDVLQRARNGQAVGHGETDAVIKAGMRMRVPAREYHPHAVERAEVEDAEQVPVHGQTRCVRYSSRTNSARRAK